jgi:hypothetical protein
MIDDNTLSLIQGALDRFHHFCDTFQVLRVRPNGFSLPRQHSLSHYHRLIRLFGAPNGLCSSITESKHIEVIKNLYWRSNHCNPLDQILVINQRLHKLAAAHIDFQSRGMLRGTVIIDVCARAGLLGMSS